MGYRKSVLPNGIRVVTERMDSVQTVSLGLWFCVGSRDESESQRGLAHFMEHMMFKGTHVRTALDISTAFDELGAESNAFTSKEQTCYYARFLADKLEPALDILADMVQHSTFENENIEPERSVVLEEIIRSDDAPDDSVFERLFQKALPDEPLGRPVLGTRETVGSFDQQICLEFHRAHYHAANLVVAASGCVDHDELVELCTQYFANFPTGERTQRSSAPLDCSSGVTIKQQDIEQAHLVHGFKGLPIGSQKRFTAGVLTTMLGGSMSSRLFQEIREQRGLVYTVFATQMTYTGFGLWGVYAGTRPENIREVVDLIEEQLRRVMDGVPDAEEVSRTIELICGQLALSQETTSSHMMRLGKRETLDLPYETIDECIAAYRRVTPVDVQELARELFGGERIISLVSPLAREDALALLQ